MRRRLIFVAPQKDKVEKSFTLCSADAPYSTVLSSVRQFVFTTPWITN